MIESRAGERLSNGTRVYRPTLDFPTSNDMGHPVGLVPQVSKSICTPSYLLAAGFIDSSGEERQNKPLVFGVRRGVYLAGSDASCRIVSSLDDLGTG